MSRLSQPSPLASASPVRRLAGHAWLPALLLALAGGVAMLNLPVVQAAPDAPRLERMAGHPGGPMHRMKPEHAERMVDRMLMGVDNVTAQQRGQLVTLTRETLRDLGSQREAGHALRKRQHELLAQPTLDLAAIEQARQQMLAHQDQVSRRSTQAMVQASQVLSPEQRAQVAQRMAAPHEGRHGGRGGRHGGPERHGQAAPAASLL